MRVSMKSSITGVVHTMDLPITIEQWNEWQMPAGRRLVQDIFPKLNDAQREFLLTGITPAEWYKYVKPTEDDDG